MDQLLTLNYNNIILQLMQKQIKTSFIFEKFGF